MAARDSAATRARVLDAAIEEFARYGLAGARVERIAANAPANKRAIYDYFGDKEALFDAAAAVTVERLNGAVPWTPDDLPGYVGRLFDHHAAHPGAIRLATWRTLERPVVDAGADLSVYRGFVAMIDDRPGADDADALPALDLGVLLLGMASAWVLANRELLAVEGEDPDRAARLEAHRVSLVDAVTRILAAAPR